MCLTHFVDPMTDIVFVECECYPAPGWSNACICSPSRHATLRGWDVSAPPVSAAVAVPPAARGAHTQTVEARV